MSNLNPSQFPEQPGLFPADHPAMRQRGLAELTPQEFAEKPGAWHHGTYAPQMPHIEPGTPLSSRTHDGGIHLGTETAAKDRLNDLGPRKPIGAHAISTDFDINKPGEIHVRRLAEDVHLNAGLPSADKMMGRKPVEKRLLGTPENPKEDRGTSWHTDFDTGEDRHVEKFGELYKNEAEDIGSISLRVPNSGYLTTHRQAHDEAVRAGKPVHPLVAGLVRDFGGRGLDTPKPYVSGAEPSKYLSSDGWADNPPHNSDDEAPDHDTLLPYKLRGNPLAAHDMPKDSYKSPHHNGRVMYPAVTFAATRRDVQDATGGGNPHKGKFNRAYSQADEDRTVEEHLLRHGKYPK